MSALQLVTSDPSFLTFLASLEANRPGMFRHAPVEDIVAAYTGYLSSYDLANAMKGAN